MPPAIWIMLACGMLSINMALSSPITCTVDDLKPGLKYDSHMNGPRSVGYKGLMYVLCYDIYLEGKAAVRCRGHGNWTEEVPPCEPILCDSPERVDNSGYHLSGWRVNDRATINCHGGFWYTGINPRICQRNRTWTGQKGECKAVKCPALPAPPFGAFSQEPPYKYQDRIEVLCNDGFLYTGSPELVCQGNNTWGGTVGTCTDIDSIHCTMALTEAIVKPELKVGKFKDTITISCPVGFSYNGTHTRTCQADGAWSGIPGRCNVKTCHPFDEEMENAGVLEGVDDIKILITHSVTKNITNVGSNDIFKYGDTVEVKCKEGYKYNGSLLTCDEHGQWNGTKGFCISVPCLEEPVISNGSINGSGFVYKDETNIECDRGYEWEGSSPHAVCTADGTWQINAQCVAVPCLDPPPITDADFEGSGYVYGDEVNVTCNSGHTWEGSTPHATCRHDGTWQVNGECRGLGVKDVLLAVVPALIALLVIVLGLPKSIRIYRQWSKPEQGTEDEENVLLGDVNEGTHHSLDESIDTLKNTVITDGHVINRNPDKKINLDNQFVKLRVVTGEGYDRMDEMNDALPDRYQDYLQRAGAENIEMEDILNHVKEETVDGEKKRKPLLMEGRAGVGKSTLVQKLMRLWAQNVWAKDYKAAFLFNIRNLTVLDKRQITLEELFMNFSVYSLRQEAGSITNCMLLDDEEYILIFLDGMDEFPGLEDCLKHGTKLGPGDKAEPIEWCISLLCRHVLGNSVLILASRPFKDLKHVNCSPVLEVVGLTRDSIMDFIDHHVAADHMERVRTTMKSNELVMSVSAITYFCMMFCMVLEEDEDATMTELTTYTRIATFFIQHYMSRCPSAQNQEIQPATSFLPPLANLAYRGLVDRHYMTSRFRLVFDQTDLQDTGITEPIRKVAEHSGMLVSSNVTFSPEADANHRESCEFAHLSIQELLAMLELLQKPEVITRKTASMMWETGSFLMAQQYLFGLCYDTESQHIQKLTNTMAEGKGQRRKLHQLIPDLIERLSTMSEDPSTTDKLLAIQMTYETQRPDLAEKVAPVLFKNTEMLSLSGTLLTAVDVNAIVYLLRNTKTNYSLRLEKITMDLTCEKFLGQNLNRCMSLKGFMFRGCTISTEGMKEILAALPQVELLSELELDHVGLNAETEEDLAEALKPMGNLISLSLEGSHWTEAGITSLGEVIKSKQNLNELNLANAELVDDNITQITAALKHISITKLSLNGNILGRQGVLKLADWLKTNPSLQHLNLANTGMVYDLVKILLEAVNTNHTLKTLDIHGEKIKETLHGLLKKNTTMEALWYTDNEDDTCTLVAVPDTGHRVVVSTGGDDTYITAWCLEDITSSSCLHHHHTVWGQEGGKLVLELIDRYTSLYGADRPPVTTDTWCHTLNQLTSSTHRVGVLGVFLSNSASLSPLLSSLTHDMIHTLIHSQVGRVEVYYGEVTCSDLLTWLSSLSSQPGWSVRAHADGTEVTNTHSGQSLVIKLVYTRVLASLHQKQQHQKHLGQGEIRLLDEPEWIIQ